MEFCSSCRRRFASFDIARRHNPGGKCLSTAELNSRGIVLENGVWHRPRVPQLRLFADRPPHRPRAVISRPLAEVSTPSDAQHQGTRSGEESAS